MQGHQRRRTRRIHRHRRTLQPQHIGNPPRRHGHTHTRTGQPIAAQLLGRSDRIPLGENPDEHPRRRAPQRQRINPGVLQRLPRALQQQPLLRIHRQRLTRADPKKPGIKLISVIHEATPTAIGLARRVGIGIKQPRHIPAAIGGKLRHHIAALGHHLPQPPRRLHPTREPTPHPHHRHRLINPRPHPRQRAYRLHHPRHLLTQIPRQRRRGGVVEDQRRRKTQPGSRFQPVTQLDRAQRVKPQILKRRSRNDLLRAGLAQHHRDLPAHQAHQQIPLRLRTQPRQALRQHRGGRDVVVDHSAPRAHQHAQQRRHRGGQGRIVQHPVVQARGHHAGVIDGQRDIKQAQRLSRAHRRQPAAPDPGHITRREVGGHRAGLLPPPPPQRDPRQPGRAPMRGQRIQKRVGRRIITLPR